MIKHILFPLMLAWVLLERVAALFLAPRRQLTLLGAAAVHVCRDRRESGLSLLPPELLYCIVDKLECVSQIGGSLRSLLAFSQ